MDQNQFCPMIKEVCKRDGCLAWNGVICSILTFYQNHQNNAPDFNWLKNIAVSREQLLVDEAQVEQMLPDCLEWAKSKKITRPTQEEIKTYLTVKNISISYPGMRLLWQQAKARLHEWKRETEQFTSEHWRDNPSNVGLAWSSEEDEALIKGFDTGSSLHDLARLHKRSVRAIELRLLKFDKIKLS